MKILPVIIIIAFPFFTDEEVLSQVVRKKASFAERNRGDNIPPPLICNVGAVSCAIGYTGTIGGVPDSLPSFDWDGKGNYHLWEGHWLFFGLKKGILHGVQPSSLIALSDTFYYSSTEFDPTAISEFDTYAEGYSEWSRINVTQRTYAWSESYRDDFIIWDVTIKNVDTTSITDSYFGLWMDYDISGWDEIELSYHPWEDDLVAFYGDDPNEIVSGFSIEDSFYISYMWDSDNPEFPGDDVGGYEYPKVAKGFIGSITIFSRATKDNLFPANVPSTHSYWEWSTIPAMYGWEYWSFLTRAIKYPNDPYMEVPPKVYDYTCVTGWGPYDLTPNDSLRFIFAVGIGEGLGGMVKNLAWAKRLYKHNWIGPPPPDPPLKFTGVAHFDRIELSWSDEPVHQTVDSYTDENDFEGFRLYKSEDRGATWTLLARFDIINDIGPNTGLGFNFTDHSVRVGYDYTYAITSYDRGDPAIGLEPLESKKIKKVITVRPGTPLLPPTASLKNIFVAPNPYYFHQTDYRGAFPQNRLGLFNLPPKCTIRIFSLGGDLVAVLEKDDDTGDAYLDPEKLKNRVSGVYLYHVQAPQGERMGKFVVIK